MSIKKTYLFTLFILLFFGLVSFALANIILLSVPGTKTLGVGENWKVGAGYTLGASAIDVKAFPRQGWFRLYKNGLVTDEKVLTEGQTYSYKGYPPGPVIFTTKLSSIFAAPASDMAQFTETYLSPSAVASCTQNWQCTSWSQCVNGKQNRVCTDANDCGTGVNTPADSQDCTSQTLDVGGRWKVGGGFIFEATALDAKALPKLGWFKLFKDGAIVDDKIVKEGETFSYNDWTLKIIAFSVKVDSIWAAQTSDMAKLTNLYILNSYLTSCVKDWKCTDWSRVCTAGGLQVRSCGDNNNCGDLSGKPSTSQNCDVKYSCTENWQCSVWSNCVNNSQTRACTDLNNCGTNTSKPIITQNCTCQENWSCDNWSACNNNIQTRVCQDLNSCGTVNNKPSITLGCISNSCVENWNCGNWSSCVNSQQSRGCIDLNGCGTIDNRPSITLRCISNPCMETWSCGVWSNCVNNSQTRACTDLNNCSTTANKPTAQQACQNQCQESWFCADWSSCQNNQQTKTCSDLNNCGTSNFKPKITQSCGTVCAENWSCDNWSSVCIDKKLTRACKDLNNCGTVITKPATAQDCIQEPQTVNSTTTAVETVPDNFIIASPSTPISATNAPPIELAVTNPQSNLFFGGVTAVSYLPGEVMKFYYKYQNTTEEPVKIKIVRQMVNAKGKIVSSYQSYKTLKAGGVFANNVKQTMVKSLPAGVYTVKVKVYNAKNKIVDENTFSIELKKKYFVLNEMPTDTDIAWDAKVWSHVKTNVRLPINLKLRFSYTNNTNTKHVIKMVRKLIDENGKVKATKTSKWAMTVGEKDYSTFTQWLGDNLPVGNYTIRIRAYDWTTKELLAENSAGFMVETR